MTSQGIASRHHPSRFAPPAQNFAHPSERAFATLLSLYGVQWRYEAVTLGLEWGSDGSMTKAFCPDFYLPEPQSFVEITVAEPRRFVRKMAKVKRARELYPEIHIALVGLRELDALCSKHGITVPFDRAA